MCVRACVRVRVHVYACALSILLDLQASYSKDGKACNSISECGLV